ncbi:MAG: serine protease [Clostridia bacterium]|nr:serine protease [Clostridia bacterium]
MKKGFLKSIAAVLLAATACFASGCGKSAYELAVESGFEGTEAEWLQSLNGADGENGKDADILEIYQTAVDEGVFSGTFDEFLREYLSLEATFPENNDTATIAENTMSVVSVYAGFTTSTQGFMGQSKEKIYSAAGSGVIIDLDKENGNATVITNYHVIYDSAASTENGVSESIYLYLYGALKMFSTDTGKDEGGDGMKAYFIGGSMDYDIAILEIRGSDILKESAATQAQIGDSDRVTVGEKVFAIGNPEGAGISVTNGVLSVDSEYIYMSSTDGLGREVRYRVMRTDAAINHGNSGGALFDAYGRLIGITNAKSTAEDVDNMGYALPINQVLGVIENCTAHGGVVKRAIFGIEVTIVDTSVVLEETGRITVKETVQITKEPTVGYAAYTQLKVGDIIKSVQINDEEAIAIDRMYYITDILLKVEKGDTVKVVIERNGNELTQTINFSMDTHFTAVA